MKMSLEEFKRVIDPLADYVIGISFSLRGEPLLNRNLPSLVKYAHDKNIGTSFPTNLSIPMDKKFAEEIVSSGLDAMFVSVDGATEESYIRYRIGGDFQLILSNVALLAETKRRLGSNTPRLIWKFVIFGYNQHEIGQVRQTHRSLGFDEVEFVRDRMSPALLERERNYNRRLVATKSACYFLWNTMVITSDGEVKPCCVPREFGIGNVKRGAKEIWRSASYRRLRLGFATKGYGENMHPVCKGCVGLAPRTKAPALVQVAIESPVAS